VRLALCRYQPYSVPNAHISGVILATYFQLLAGRSAFVTLDPDNDKTLPISISGITYENGNLKDAEVYVTLETLVDKDNGTWISINRQELKRLGQKNENNHITVWYELVIVPDYLEGFRIRNYRLRIEEFEILFNEFENGQFKKEQGRLVYLDHIYLEYASKTQQPSKTEQDIAN
jgi:hypothetical protein